MTTVISPGAEARAHCQLTVAAERLWNAGGVEALRALQAGEIDVAADAERNWP